MQEIYFTFKFDIILIYKWNIVFYEKKEFINKLSQLLNKDGIIYITSVEYDRFYKNIAIKNNMECLYLNNKIIKFFNIDDKRLSNNNKSYYCSMKLSLKKLFILLQYVIYNHYHYNQHCQYKYFCWKLIFYYHQLLIYLIFQ